MERRANSQEKLRSYHTKTMSTRPSDDKAGTEIKMPEKVLEIYEKEFTKTCIQIDS